MKVITTIPTNHWVNNIENKYQVRLLQLLSGDAELYKGETEIIKEIVKEAKILKKELRKK